MEEEKIKTVKIWLKLQLIRDMQVFIGFANFYHYCIKGFSKIAVPLTSMLKTMALSTPTRLVNVRVDENKLNMRGKEISNSISSGKINDKIINLLSTKKISFGAGFLTPKTSLTFTQ